jgi:uncharacterized protein (TIGR00369 family)
MTDFESLRALVASVVPFNNHVGIEVLEVGPGRGVARLPEAPHLLNHVQTQHAGALFTAAETASGAAMLSVFADRLGSATPVARRCSVEYRRPARGPITATATIATPADELLSSLDADGVVEFPASVVLHDADDREVASVEVTWHVRTNR